MPAPDSQASPPPPLEPPVGPPTDPAYFTPARPSSTPSSTPSTSTAPPADTSTAPAGEAPAEADSPAKPLIPAYLAPVDRARTLDATSHLGSAELTPVAPPAPPGLLPAWLPGALGAMGILLAAATLMRAARKNHAKRREALDLSARERIDAIRAQARQRATHDDDLADAHDIARRLAAHLDTKAAALQHLLTQSERALARLEHAARAADDRLEALRLASESARHTPPQPAPASAAGHAPTRPPAAGAKPTPSPRPAAPAAPRPASHPSHPYHPSPAPPPSPATQASALHHAAAAAADRHPSEPDLLRRQIYALADEGLDPVEIARRLHQHTGSVELILALRSA